MSEIERLITTWYTDDAKGTVLDFDDLPSLVTRIEALVSDAIDDTRGAN